MSRDQPQRSRNLPRQELPRASSASDLLRLCGGTSRSVPAICRVRSYLTHHQLRTCCGWSHDTAAVHEMSIARDRVPGQRKYLLYPHPNQSHSSKPYFHPISVAAGAEWDIVSPAWVMQFDNKYMAGIRLGTRTRSSDCITADVSYETANYSWQCILDACGLSHPRPDFVGATRQ